MRLKATAQASPAKDLKLKAVVQVAPLDDEDTCSGPVFKRRRKAAPAPTEQSTSNGRSPSQQIPPSNPSPARDIRAQESRGENL